MGQGSRPLPGVAIVPRHPAAGSPGAGRKRRRHAHQATSPAPCDRPPGLARPSLATGQIYANFYSIDPDTGLPPDVLTGFLPPEDGTGRGMGHISYIVRPKAGLATGTEIRNIALISLDGQPWIATDQVDPHDPSKGTDPWLGQWLTDYQALAPEASPNACIALVIGVSPTPPSGTLGAAAGG